MQKQQDSETRPEVKTTIEETTEVTKSVESTEIGGEPTDGEIVPDPLDEAEKRSEEAWEKAGEAVDDLKKLGHETDEPNKP